MGYRARLGRVDKTEKARFSGKTCEQVEQILGEDGAAYRPDFHTQMFELGKYCDFNIKPESFYDFDINEECESEFHIIGKDGLKQIISEYHANVYENYKEISETGDWRMFNNARLREWNKDDGFGLLPYKLDDTTKDGNIVNSWQYEYTIFELVYIYRTFDWDKDYLIYSAW